MSSCRVSRPGSSTAIGSRAVRLRPRLRCDPDKVLLDPYGQAVAVPPHYSRRAAQQPGANTAVAMKSAVADPQAYDWQGMRRCNARSRRP